MKNQRGATLIIVMLLLIVLTLVGLALVTTSNIASDVSGNLKASEVAYQAAETCLRLQVRRYKNWVAAGRPPPEPGAIDPGNVNNVPPTLSNDVTCTCTQPVSIGVLTSFGSGNGGEISYNGGTGGGAPTSGTSNYRIVATGRGPRGSIMTLNATVNF